MAKNAWTEFATPYLKAAGPSRAAKVAAMKTAGEDYRAMKRGHSGRKSNPSNKWVNWLLIGGAAVWGYKKLKPAAAPAVNPNAKPGTTGALP